MLPTYKPSGAVGAGTWLALIPIMIVGAVTAVLYQAAVHFIPFIYVNALIMLGLAVVVATATWKGLLLGKCRNVAIGSFVGAIVGVGAVAASHAAEYWYNTRGIADPPALGEYVTTRAWLGWTLGPSGSGLPITGVFFYVIWGIEGLVITLAGVAGGFGAASVPFCERCDRHATKSLRSKTAQAPADEAVSVLRNASSVRELFVPLGTNPDASSPNKIIYELQGCPSCDDVGSISIRWKHTTTKGKEQRETTDCIVSDVPLTRDECKAAEAFIDKL